MKDMSHIVNSNLTKRESNKPTFVQSKKKTQIGKYLILMLFVSTFLISESGVCAAGSDIRYGFWTIWRDPNSYQPDWNALTHIGYSEWKVNSDGSLVAPADMTHFTTVRDQTHAHGKKFEIVIVSADPSAMDSIFANHKQDFANNVLSTVQKYGADGVNIDFEFPKETNSITKTSNKVVFESFMSTLYTTLKNANPNYHISLDSTAGVQPVYANSNLAKYLDHLVIMEYDFQSGLGKTGPNSPYNDPTRYDILKSVNDWDNYFTKQQMILALPFYGYKYSSATDQPGSTYTKIEQLDMKVAVQTVNQRGRLWDSNSNSPWCRYNDGSSWQQIWYDDAQSLKLRYDYIKSQNIAGVAFWALDCETSDVWKVFQPGQTVTPTLPVADFSSNVTSGYVPLSVQFTDLSKYATGRSWNFGDGTSSTQQNPVHTYSAAGNYTVTDTASNANGTNAKSKVITVSAKSVAQPLLPIADFSTNVTSGNAPLSVKFTDLSKYATSGSWNFGDGTSTTQQNPVHTYSAAGNYTVTDTASNANGTNSKSKVITVLSGSGAPGAPVAAFSASPTYGRAPLTVRFTDRSTGSPTSGSWNFGDGTSSTLKSPSHVYSRAGRYTVSQTVNNAAGSNTVTRSNYINVR